MKNERMLVLMAIVLVFTGCMGAAKSRSRSISQPMSEKASIQYGFCYDAYIQSDLIPALGACLQAEKETANNADIKNLLGLIYFRQDKKAEAEAKFQEALDLDPKLSEALNNLGTLYYEEKKYDEALVTLNKALENPLYLYPERIHNNLGLAYAALDRLTEAEAQFLRAINLNKDFFLPYQNLARIYFDRGEFAKAKPLLTQVNRICQDCTESRFQLGKVLLTENRKGDALKVWKEGAKLDPNGHFGQLCSENLKTIDQQ